MVGGIRMGMVKLILRVLLSLGCVSCLSAYPCGLLTIRERYQCHFRVLQAGQYGAPQSRLRVIFMAAKRGLLLPKFPVPTHCTADDVQHYNLETGNLLRPVVRVVPTDDRELGARQTWLQFAPHLRVSVEDAISDLVRTNLIQMLAIAYTDSMHVAQI